MTNDQRHGHRRRDHSCDPVYGGPVGVLAIARGFGAAASLVNAISTNRREEVEMTALCLRILQAVLAYVNTLMLQDVLTEPEWAALLTPGRRRVLTPLFWLNVRPYGEVRLDLNARLSIGALVAG